MEKFLENKDAKIYVNECIADGSTKAVVLIHGLCEHSGRYADFISELNQSNISVFAIDLRGHGKTVGKRGDSESFIKVLDDVNIVIDYIKMNYDFKQIGIFGHSIGGLVASTYASSYKGMVDYLVLSSPAIYCPKKLRFIKFIPYNLLSFIYVKKKYSESKEMLEYSKNDEFALHTFSIRTVGVFFSQGIEFLNKNLCIECPTMLLCGKLDPLLSETYRFEELFSKLTNKANKLIVYEDAKHRIVQNEGSSERIKDILSWLENV
ncbi:MAG: alpha/beta fold hydrolase [Clostridia bacterium]|nr:alpha/beta fold hydrolase [Clostridia bacterium]